MTRFLQYLNEKELYPDETVANLIAAFLSNNLDNLIYKYPNFKEFVTQLNLAMDKTNLEIMKQYKIFINFEAKPIAKTKFNSFSKNGLEGGMLHAQSLTVYINKKVMHMNDYTNFIKTVKEIINHEMIHYMQKDKSKGHSVDLKYGDEKLTDSDAVNYYLHIHEITPMAYSAIQEFLRSGHTKDEILNIISKSFKPNKKDANTIPLFLIYSTIGENYLKKMPHKLYQKFLRTLYRYVINLKEQ